MGLPVDLEWCPMFSQYIELDQTLSWWSTGRLWLRFHFREKGRRWFESAWGSYVLYYWQIFWLTSDVLLTRDVSGHFKGVTNQYKSIFLSRWVIWKHKHIFTKFIFTQYQDFAWSWNPSRGRYVSINPAYWPGCTKITTKVNKKVRGRCHANQTYAFQVINTSYWDDKLVQLLVKFTVMTWHVGLVWLLLEKCSLSRSFPDFHHWQCTGNILNIRFIFDRCHRSSSAVITIKYESNLKNLTGIFLQIEI